MNYFKRQHKLIHFLRFIKLVLSDDNLATDRVGKDVFFKKIKEIYFSKEYPLENRINNLVFPKATKEFIKSKENGHTLDSMERDLNFLKLEFDDYFDDLIDKQVLIINIKNNDSTYRINHNSAKVYWVLGIGFFASFLWKFFEISKKIGQIIN